MPSLDDLARAAEEAQVVDLHDRPVTDADLGEMAAEGAQVTMGANAAAAVTVSGPELAQIPTSTPVAPMEQVAAPTTPQPATILPPVAAPTEPAAQPLTPFNAQITQDTAPVAPAPTMQPMQPQVPTAQTSVQIEQPSAPLAAGTMPGQTVSPQTTVATPVSHIIADSFPKPATGVDPLSGIAV